MALSEEIKKYLRDNFGIDREDIKAADDLANAIDTGNNDGIVAVTAHLVQSNPHPQYAMAADANVAKVGPGRQYTTIQSALTAIGNATSVADLKNPQLVSIADGIYDEDLIIPRGRIITLLAEGTVILGNGLGTNFGSTNTRSISVTFNVADVFGSDVKPALTIVTIPNSDATSSFIAESGMFRISGNLNIIGDGLTNTLNLHSVKLDGNLVHTTAALTNWQAYRTLIAGTVTTTGNLVLERAYDCRFNSLVSINAYNMVANSSFLAGMTVQSIQQNLLPNGMFFSNFSGVFTGPANSLRVDSASDYYFRINGATLGGSASKVLLSNHIHSGVTGSRPSTVGLLTGYMYFDTTLGKPIWNKAGTWVDATGANA